MTNPRKSESKIQETWKILEKDYYLRKGIIYLTLGVIASEIIPEGTGSQTAIVVRGAVSGSEPCKRRSGCSRPLGVRGAVSGSERFMRRSGCYRPLGGNLVVAFDGATFRSRLAMHVAAI